METRRRAERWDKRLKQSGGELTIRMAIAY